MPFRLHVVVFGALGVAFGLAELVAPIALMRLYGLELDAGGAAVVRLAAALNLGFGLTAIFARRVSDAAGQRAVLLGGLSYAVVALAVTAHATLSGAVGPMMWSNLLICVPLGLNAGRLLLAARG
ncbi:MAG: hypothetical protein IT373_02100, partial [Polyangiaceae bacterium]|nr:hypothetical protein [Polyangiaceae bacterium]